MSIAECLRLERLSHREKVQHWNQKNPWEGLKLPRKVAPVEPGHIFFDEHGNITKMPPLIGRPCFGQVTAYLRHGGDQQFWNPRTSRWMNSRCMRCPMVGACESVAEERLHSTPEISKAYRAWLRMGGRRSTWKVKGKGGLAQILYRNLLQELHKASFSSCNDQVAAAHYEAVLEARREKDRLRQSRKRLAQRLARARAGQFDNVVESLLNDQRVWRQIRHAEARADPAGPQRLKQSPSSSSVFDSRVWLAKARIELQGKKANDSNIAREMQSLGFELHRTHNALRDPVRRSLTRILLLECDRLPGRSEPIWPRFGQQQLREALDWCLPGSVGPLAA